MSPEPSPVRLSAACVGAAGAAAAPTILLGGLAVIVLPFGFAVALAHVLLLALPVYLLMRRRMRIDWAHAMISGFVIGALPVSMWSWSMAGDDYWNTSSILSLVAGVLGTLGGMTFRAIIGPPHERTGEVETAAIFE